MTVALPAKRWKELGVRPLNGKPLPEDLPDAALVSGTKQHYLVFSSYDALLDYNCSHSYAITVGLLADRIGTAPAAAPPAKPKPGPPKRRAAFQNPPLGSQSSTRLPSGSMIQPNLP